MCNKYGVELQHAALAEVTILWTVKFNLFIIKRIYEQWMDIRWWQWDHVAGKVNSEKKRKFVTKIHTKKIILCDVL